MFIFYFLLADWSTNIAMTLLTLTLAERADLMMPKYSA